MSLMIRFPQSNYWRFCSTTESQPAFWTLRKMLWSLCILPAPEMQERMAKLLYSRQTSWMWRIIPSSTLLQTATDFLKLSLFYGAVKRQPYFLEQAQTIEICHKTDDEGGRWIEECCKTPYFIYAPVKEMRQQAQQGRYILFPNHIEHDQMSFYSYIDKIEKNADSIAGRILVASSVKKKILKELALFGITKETLFCDSIDVVCESIKGKFEQKVRGQKQWQLMQPKSALKRI